MSDKAFTVIGTNVVIDCGTVEEAIAYERELWANQPYTPQPADAPEPDSVACDWDEHGRCRCKAPKPADALDVYAVKRGLFAAHSSLGPGMCSLGADDFIRAYREYLLEQKS